MENASPQDKRTATQARIRAVTPLSLCDWPGKSTSVVYVGGCNLRCPTCHNASLAFTPNLHPVLELSAVVKGLVARKRWLDGVVVCGGEPTLDPGLPDLVEALFGIGLAVKVDTNGMRPDVVAEILTRFPQTLFAVDVKGPWEKYPGLTGQAVSPQDAQDHLEAVFSIASNNPGSFAFRITVVPGLTPHDVRVAGGYLPVGFTLKEQPFVLPVYGKETPHAPADSEARRLPGNLVPGPDRSCHTEGP